MKPQRSKFSWDKLLFLVVAVVSVLLIGYIVPEPLTKAEKAREKVLFNAALEQQDEFESYLKRLAADNGLKFLETAVEQKSSCHGASSWINSHEDGTLERRCSAYGRYWLGVADSEANYEAVIYKYSDANFEKHSNIPLLSIHTYKPEEIKNNKYIDVEVKPIIDSGVKQILILSYQDDFQIADKSASVGLRWDKFFR